MITLIKSQRPLFINFFGKAVAAISGIVVVPLFTGSLDKKTFAQIALLWLLLPVLQRITSSGSDAIIAMKYFKNSAIQNSELIWTSLRSFFIISLIIFPALVLYSERSNTLNISWQDWGLILFTLLTSNMCVLFSYVKRMEHRPEFSVIVESSKPFLIAISTFALFKFGETSISGYIRGMAIGSLPLFIAILAWARKHQAPKFSIRAIWRHFKIGAPVLPSSISALVFMMGDRYIIELFLGLNKVADYALGFKLAEFLLVSIFVPFSQTANVEILKKAKQSTESACRYISQSTSLFFTIIASITFLGWECSELLLSMAGEPSYKDAEWIFRSMLGTISLYYLSSSLNSLFYHLEKPWIPTSIGLIGAAASISLNFTLIPLFGIKGAVFASLGANSCVVIAQWVAYQNNTCSSFSEILKIYSPWMVLACITVIMGSQEHFIDVPYRAIFISLIVISFFSNTTYLSRRHITK